MQLTVLIAAFAAIVSVSAAPAPEANPTHGKLKDWLTAWKNKHNKSPSVPRWPPAPPSRYCPDGWPKPHKTWDQKRFRYPGVCKPKHIPVYKSRCKKSTRPPKYPHPHPNPNPNPNPVPTTSPNPVPTTLLCPVPTGGPNGGTTTTPNPSTSVPGVPIPTLPPSPEGGYFHLKCPDQPAGSIFDGQVQCNSPYPAIDLDTPGKGPAFVDTKFYLVDGALFDQADRACEISAGNQLQCNKINDNSQAMKGFSVNENNELEFNSENTWYACAIGTDDSFGSILFTGTHKDFNGNQDDTSNPNCDAYRLTLTYLSA